MYFNVHVKVQLLMYYKGGFFTFEFSTPGGGLRNIRKTELEENNGILKNPLYTLHKGPKRHNICSILPPNRKSCKNEIAYYYMLNDFLCLLWLCINNAKFLSVFKDVSKSW